jgi:hypothetical protein
MAGHRSHSKIADNAKIYQFMRLIGTEHFNIILLELFPCNSKEELRAREHYYITTLKPVLNTNDSIMNLEKMVETKRLSGKIYREVNSDKISIKKADYYEENKQAICDKAQTYRDTHQEKIKAEKKKLIKCDACKIDISYPHYARHCKTKKHLDNAQSLI